MWTDRDLMLGQQTKDRMQSQAGKALGSQSPLPPGPTTPFPVPCSSQVCQAKGQVYKMGPCAECAGHTSIASRRSADQMPLLHPGLQRPTEAALCFQNPALTCCLENLPPRDQTPSRNN